VPSWQPPWQDVRFDHAAAHAAAAALDSAANRLAAHLDRRASAVHAARAQWQGQHRDRFDAQFRASQVEGHDIVLWCRRLAAEARAASDQARLEQARRQRLRDRWHAERAVEAAALERAAESERCAAVARPSPSAAPQWR
jgi:uncharacterized protein YukE